MSSITMENYLILKTLGDGAFGTVSLGEDLSTGETVAIKTMKRNYSSWDECLKMKEVNALKVLKHENIVQLKEMIRDKEKLNLVFECMSMDLLALMKEQNGDQMSESMIRSIMFQVVNGLSYIHKKGFFHRDLKPENLLIKKDKVKIGDFGLAKEIRSLPPYTDYVSTRWYRAPECVLKSTNYSSPIDIWALGAIMCELYTGKPIFNGMSEKDLVYKMASVLGTPSNSSWAEGLALARKINFKFPQFENSNLSSILSTASVEAVDLISQMLQWDPDRRPTCQGILSHPFFTKNQIFNMTLSNQDLSPSGTQTSFKSNRPKYRNADQMRSSLAEEGDCFDIDQLVADLKKEKEDTMLKSSTFSSVSEKEDRFVSRINAVPKKEFEFNYSNQSRVIKPEFIDGSRRRQVNYPKNDIYGYNDTFTVPDKQDDFKEQRNVYEPYKKPQIKDNFNFDGIAFNSNKEVPEKLIHRRKLSKENNRKSTEPFQFESRRQNHNMANLLQF